MEAQGWSGQAIAVWIELVAGAYAIRLNELIG
jgi:hypothetical protein